MVKLAKLLFSFIIALSGQLYAQNHEVWINEIYADETPSFGMPDAEFLELKNSTTDTIALNNWSISDASDTTTIPVIQIPPQEYLILCKTSAENLYQAYGHTLGVPSFPSLNNTGDAIVIWNEFGQLVDSVTYDKDFYHDQVDGAGNVKSAGGYSLERLATSSPCESVYNWFPSSSVLGATPGQENSALSLAPPALEPELVELSIKNDSTLELIFTGEFYNFSEQNVSLENHSIEQLIYYSYDSVYIHLEEPLIPNENYKLSFSGLKDCWVNVIHLDDHTFYYYDEIMHGDIVINEVLFNPHTGGVDFIELYNPTSKQIRLEGFVFKEYDSFLPKEILEEDLIVLGEMGPEEYHVFTTDTSNIKLQYDVFEPRWLHENGIPNLPNEEGILVIEFPDGRVMDSLYYQSSWHLATLDLQDGVSLERIQASDPRNQQSNWHSAAKTYGYATPTAANSQSTYDNTEGMFTIHPEVFTPNGDGDKDFCQLSYQSDRVGEIATLSIYDIRGRQVSLLAQNHSLGKNNTWKWSGLNNQQERAAVGIYVALLEVFDESGRTKRFKEKVVLGLLLH